MPTFVDFFAGSGLVTEGVRHACVPVWANDICPKKAAIYTANHGFDHFHLGSIEEVRGWEIPHGEIVWASFPCQDLSLAGKQGGLAASRSGLFWQWLRVLDEMPVKPLVIALENVVGLLSANSGEDYRMLHRALQERSYRVGPMLIDARHWVPQSRPRVFVVAARHDISTASVEDDNPNWLHPKPVLQAVSSLDDVIYWSLPVPKKRASDLSDLIDWNATAFDQSRTDALLDIVASAHRKRLEKLPRNTRAVFPGYRRTRNGRQVLELRFDNISGCLRTAEGGSSRQFLLLHNKGEWTSRLITPREAALIMGAPPEYELSPSYNESYNAMGDAVVVPVVSHLVDNLFLEIIRSAHAAGSSKPASRVRLIA